MHVTNDQRLDLSFKGLTKIPTEGDFGLPNNVLALCLRGNLLRDIGREIASFPNLRELDASKNRISSISVEIQSLRHLEVLILDENDLASLPPEVFRLVKLKRLAAVSNHLQQIDRAIFRLAELEKLELWGNQLEVFPSFQGLGKLRELGLGANALRILPDNILDAGRLEVLSVHRNNLTALPSAIGALPWLQRLHVGSNQLRDLPPSLGAASRLVGLTLNDNPFDSPLRELAHSGTEAVKQFLRTAATGAGTSTVREIKLALLGDPDVGKTAIVERLVSDVYRDFRSPTPGVHITKWNMAGPTGEVVVSTNVWDFGGQEIYHSTHRYFLSKGAVFVVVLDSGRPVINARLEYWLSTIAAIDEKARVLIVANKLDEGNVDLDFASLRNLYPSIGGFFRISCKSPGIRGNQLDELRKELAASCLERPSANWPNVWLPVRAALERDARPYLAKADYLELCESLGVGVEPAMSLATYLHELGMILHFPDDVQLSQIMVRSPEWATRPVYDLLGSQTVKDRGGRLAEAYLTLELERVVGDDPLAAPAVRQLMLKFKLLYKLPHDDAYVVPELLPDLRPDFELVTEPWSSFACSYRFVPPGIIASLIIRLHEEIPVGPDGNPRHWRHGLIVQMDDTLAEISIDHARARLRVHVAGPRVEKLRDHVMSVVERANRSFPRIDANLGVQCRCTVDCQYVHPIRRLNRDWAAESLVCDLTGLKVNIGLLLFGEVTKLPEDQSERSGILAGRSVFMNVNGDVNMGDKFEAGRDMRAIGSKSVISNSNVQSGRDSTVHTAALAVELEKMISAMRSEGISSLVIDVAEQAAAEAKAGNLSAALSALKRVGRETYEVAKKIGAPVVTEILKHSLDL